MNKDLLRKQIFTVRKELYNLELILGEKEEDEVEGLKREIRALDELVNHLRKEKKEEANEPVYKVMVKWNGGESCYELSQSMVEFIYKLDYLRQIKFPHPFSTQSITVVDEIS